MHFGTWIYTKLFGSLIGKDIFGNKYYQAKSTSSFDRPKRWVYYKGICEPTKVPASWNSWLNHQNDEIDNDFKEYAWQLDVQPNLSGTEYAKFPVAHVLNKSKRNKVSADYTAWQPKLKEQ